MPTLECQEKQAVEPCWVEGGAGTCAKFRIVFIVVG